MNKILIIEDEKILFEMYKEKLEREGFKVFGAFTVDEGIEIAKKEKVDLIILDILLPVKNGISFLKDRVKEKEIANIPVIVFSNYDEPTVKKEALSLGAKEYLIKTDHIPKDIVEKIRKYLSQ